MKMDTMPHRNAGTFTGRMCIQTVWMQGGRRGFDPREKAFMKTLWVPIMVTSHISSSFPLLPAHYSNPGDREGGCSRSIIRSDCTIILSPERCHLCPAWIYVSEGDVSACPLLGLGGACTGLPGFQMRLFNTGILTLLPHKGKTKEETCKQNAF